MNCWTILGLRADADERAIKRSYSALLKVHRPDEDLDAFQRLRGAYEQALMIARRRAEEQDEDDRPMSAAADPGRVGDAGLIAELERPKTLADEAEVAQAQMLASLVDLAPPILDAIAAQAQADGRLALFERCLLERCLNDSEQGYSATQWALARLGWLTPWQEASLPSMQLDGLANRLLATELHGLHALLAEGDEQAFLERVAALHEQGWLQPFDLRALFHQRLVELLLAVPGWTPACFDRLRVACGWNDEAGHLPCDAGLWRALLRRDEGPRLKDELNKHMAELWPFSPEQSAAWMLLKPLDDGKRRRLADGFNEFDWQACFSLQDVLEIRHPELIGEFNESGIYDWRGWVPGEAWASTYRYLLILYIGIYLSGYWWSGGLAKDTLPTLLILAGAVAVLAFVFIGLSIRLQNGWRAFCLRVAGFDVALSKFLLPRAWVRQGAGLLLLRHFVPAAVVGLSAWFLGLNFAEYAPVVGGVSAVLALLFADSASKGWSPRKTWGIVGAWLRKPWGVLRRFLGRFGRFWRMLKIGVLGALMLTGTAFAVWHFKDALPPQFKKPFCAMALVFDGKCEVPGEPL